MVLGITSLFLVPAIIVSDHFEVNSWWFILASMPVYGMSTAFFVAETQKELMSRGTGFLLPDLGKTVISSQLVIMSGLGLLSFLLAFFLPALAPVTTGNFLHSLSLSFLVMMVFSLTLLVDFLFRYSSWLTSTIVLPFFLYISLGKNADAQIYHQWMSESGILLLGSALFLALNLWILKSLDLPRRLAEQPYISTLQIYQPDKVQEFKNRHGGHAQSKDQSGRPLKNTMDYLLARTARARFSGQESWAIFWETLYLGISTSTPRLFMGPWNYAFFVLPFILVIGYADSNNHGESGMEGWFSAFPFMFATLPVVAFHFLGINPMGFPRNRKASEKAGYLFMGWTFVAVVVLSVLVFGMMHFLGAVMPEFETATRIWSYQPSSRLHTPFLPLLILPPIFLVYLFCRRSFAQAVLGGVGMQFFLLYNFLLSGGDYGWPLQVALGVSVGSLIALPFVWRRKLRQGY